MQEMFSYTRNVSFQLQGLRDALDQVTMEKSSILSQLTVQRDEMTSLTNQLAGQQQRMVTMTTAKDQMSTELYSCQQSLVSGFTYNISDM